MPGKFSASRFQPADKKMIYLNFYVSSFEKSSKIQR